MRLKPLSISDNNPHYVPAIQYCGVQEGLMLLQLLWNTVLIKVQQVVPYLWLHGRLRNKNFQPFKIDEVIAIVLTKRVVPT